MRTASTLHLEREGTRRGFPGSLKVFFLLYVCRFWDKNSECRLHSRLLKILCNSLAMLRHFTPDICGILFDQVNLGSYEIVEVVTLDNVWRKQQ